MIKEIYDTRREALQKELSRCEDVKAAADCVGAALEKLRLDARAQADAPVLRHETDRLFASARQAACLMLSVTEADVSLRRTRGSGREGLMGLLPWASCAAGLVLTLWMLLIGQNAAAGLSLVSAALGLLQAWRRREGALPDVSATTKVNVYELMRISDRLIQALDDALEDAVRDRAALPGDGGGALTGEMFAPVQMLMEAVYTGDGGYALKAAPQLVAALEAQGIEPVEYTPDRREWFDMFPGTEDGLTIRPALVKEGRLLARGQATEAEDRVGSEE